MNENSENYLSLIYGSNRNDLSLTDKDMAIIENNLWTLLSNRTERYTMGDSTSVPIETAQELLKSICFSIGIYLKSANTNINILKNENFESLLKSSWPKIEMKIHVGKGLLNKLNENTLPVENISFNDTINGLSVFFKQYDYRFFAHEIPGDIDYQLCHAVPVELLGIEYINEYLHRLLIENKFIRKFNANNIKLLLESYCPDYKGLLINVYEPVVSNALGLELINCDVLSLDITDTDRNHLLKLFKIWSKDEATAKLEQAADKLCLGLQITDSTEIQYLKSTSVNLYSRIESVLDTNCLDNIFLPLYNMEQPAKPDAEFVDGVMMNDHELQVFIDEINNCRYLSDKISMFKQQVHSLQDCVEVLSICFWVDECLELFKSLDRAELELLLNYVQQKQDESPDWCSETGWEQQLIKHLEK